MGARAVHRGLIERVLVRICGFIRVPYLYSMITIREGS